MKKILLFLIVSAISAASFAQISIVTKKVTGGPFCSGTSINVGYTVTPAANPGNVFTAQLSDKNGDFTAPVNIGTLVKTTNGTIPCTIPLGTVTSKKYKVRVISSSPATVGIPCDNKVSINPTPFELSLTNVTACQATLNWTGVSTASSYKVQYKLNSSSTWSSSQDAGFANSYTFTGLVSGSSYDFQVRSICSNNEKSDWKKITGSTAACNVPTGIIVTNTTITTGTIDWADAPCTTGYLLQYRAFGEPDWIGPLTTAVSNYTLTGLFAATLYEVQVANDCGTFNSAWSNSVIFETQYFRLAGDAETVSAFNVFPNPSSGDFTVSYNNATENNLVEISVQNIYGQVVFQSNKQVAAGTNEENIKLQNATSGLYFVTIKSGSKQFKTSLMVD